jgi:N-methylhydantoinase B/oxoprolinase/acetone carboxylase alpha subunit
VGVERIELITDSAGAGRFRGGLGVRADYRILTDGVSATAVLSRYVVAPRGRAGGGPRATNHTVVIAQDGGEQVHGFETFPVVRGQVVSHRTGGGGGWAMQSVATRPVRRRRVRGAAQPAGRDAQPRPGGADRAGARRWSRPALKSPTRRPMIRSGAS